MRKKNLKEICELRKEFEEKVKENVEEVDNESDIDKQRREAFLKFNYCLSLVVKDARNELFNMKFDDFCVERQFSETNQRNLEKRFWRKTKISTLITEGEVLGVPVWELFYLAELYREEIFEIPKSSVSRLIAYLDELGPSISNGHTGSNHSDESMNESMVGDILNKEIMGSYAQELSEEVDKIKKISDLLLTHLKN